MESLNTSSIKIEIETIKQTDTSSLTDSTYMWNNDLEQMMWCQTKYPTGEVITPTYYCVKVNDQVIYKDLGKDQCKKIKKILKSFLKVIDNSTKK